MSHIEHLQLVLPQALTQLRNANTQKQDSLLCRWLVRGARRRLWQQDDLQHARLDPWQHSLLHAFDPEVRANGLASAMLHWRGEGGAWRQGTLLHVELVHLAAGLDNVRLLVPPRPPHDESVQLLSSLQPLLSLAGFELLSSPAAQPGHWYLSSERILSLTSYSPRAGFATRIYDIMPQGAGGADLRRLMTEAQMILHEHPVNQQRARRSELDLNAVWFWGAAPLELVSERGVQRVLSNDAYVRGLCEHLHLQYWPLPPDAQALLSVGADQQLVVLSEQPLAQLESAWFQPLQTALQRGGIKRLDIHLDQWCISLRGGRWPQLRRLLARQQALPSELLA
jgi:hypothetical protein